jgi:hypothetical protein
MQNKENQSQDHYEDTGRYYQNLCGVIPQVCRFQDQGLRAANEARKKRLRRLVVV